MNKKPDDSKTLSGTDAGNNRVMKTKADTTLCVTGPKGICRIDWAAPRPCLHFTTYSQIKVKHVIAPVTPSVAPNNIWKLNQARKKPPFWVGVDAFVMPH